MYFYPLTPLITPAALEATSSSCPLTPLSVYASQQEHLIRSYGTPAGRL